MYTLVISICALILGYIFYGKFISRIFGPDDRPTPAITKNDGMDYVVMPTWKVFMIQFLNIAGTGPIFGAIMGAKFGPSCYLWIVFGCIFAGAVHDYLSGMMSVRLGGASLPDVVGHYLGNKTKKVMLTFSVALLIIVGAVFVYSPASILGGLTQGFTGGNVQTITFFWVAVVLIYYIASTLFPVDKIIGKIYPVFAFALLFMAVSLLGYLLVKWPSTMPEVWDGLQNRNPAGGSLFPCLFITIACGAISGFHATQSPMMARCLKNEKLGRPIFYGSMITEGVVALIWAAIGIYFFYGGGAGEMGAVDASGKVTVGAAPAIVKLVSTKWLGIYGSVLALLGVVAAPVTSGDTALRGARLILADAMGLDQKPMRNRLRICVPMFALTAVVLWFSIADANGFDIIWRYFGWANQTLSIFTLWAITSFLVKERKGLSYLVALIPACLMTSVCFTFILTAKIGFNVPAQYTKFIAVGIAVMCLFMFFQWYNWYMNKRK